MEHNQRDGQTEISRFLEKFNKEENSFTSSSAVQKAENTAHVQQEQYNQSFEKLEEKIKELEDKFAASAAQNQAVMQELVRTRQAVENQRSKEAFFANIATTISNLKQSVETLSQNRQVEDFYHTIPPTPMYNTAPALDLSAQLYETQRNTQEELNKALAENERMQTELHTERIEKTQLLSAWQKERNDSARELESSRAQSVEKARIISSLQQKASQLKAVNVALDREIKRVQAERTEALRKSAEQAKEILSLRDALTAAEERFKSFNFEGRVISIKRQYEQKVNHLETQLHEISDTCMKQVEEIESLKAENLKLHQLAEEREQLSVLYEEKTQEVASLQAVVTQLREETEQTNPARLAALTQRLQRLQREHESLSERLTNTQDALQAVSAEKQTIEENFQALLAKIKQNDEVIASLRKNIAVLTEENEELKKGQATVTENLTALTEENEALKKDQAAATKNMIVLTEENEALKKDQAAAQKDIAALTEENQQLKKNQALKQAPAAPVLRRPLAPLRPMILKKPVLPPAAPVVPTTEKTQSTSSEKNASPDTTLSQSSEKTIRRSSYREEDLPEIRVPEPMEQEDLYDGEDFLEKTDSFIGRMKWSLFRDDK